MARNAFKILVKNGIHPVRSQISVTLGQRIWTRMDAVGVRKRGNSWRPVVIELKSTMQTLKAHSTSYDKTCRRRKQLAVINLPNSERVAHNLQARFGAYALSTVPEFRNMSIEAVVVVVSRTGTRLYECPVMPREAFSLASNLAPASEPLESPGFMRLPGPKRGGLLIRTYLKGKGFKRVAAGTSKASFRALMPSCAARSSAGAAGKKTAKADGDPVIGAIVPDFNGYSEPRRAATRRRLIQISGKHTNAVIVHRIPGGWGHTLVNRAT